jgi:hypothetical protein
MLGYPRYARSSIKKIKSHQAVVICTKYNNSHPIFHHHFSFHTPNLVLNRLSNVGSKTLRSENDVELELAGGGAAGTLVLAGGRVVLDGVEVDDKVVLDGEDGVGCEPGVVLGVDLSDDGLVVFVGDLWLLS